MAQQQQLKIAMFGSTGGCCKAALQESLQAGHKITALVRTPEKLLQLLGVTECPANLTMVQGDVRNLQSVKQVVEGNDIVISGIGAVPGLGAYYMPTIDGTICREAMANIITAIKEATHRPTRVISISTTGVNTEVRNIPLLVVPFYWLLHTPHQDKSAMENALVAAGEEGIVKEWIIVRPALLTNGAKTGKYRIGLNEIGYTISRDDVGNFVANNLTDNTWVNKRPIVCY